MMNPVLMENKNDNATAARNRNAQLVLYILFECQ